MYQGVKKLGGLGIEEGKAQLKLLTELAKATVVIYGQTDCYALDNTLPLITQHVRLDVTVSMALRTLTCFTITQETAQYLFMENMFTMFGLQLCKGWSVEDLLAGVEQNSNPMNDQEPEVRALTLDVAALMLIYYPECAKFSQDRWKASGYTMLNDVMKAFVRWTYSRGVLLDEVPNKF